MKNDSCKILSIQNSKSWKLHPFGFSKVKRHPFAGSKCHHETSLACLELNDVFTKKHLEHQGGTTGYCDCTGIAEGISEVHDLPQDPQWKHIFFVIYCTFGHPLEAPETVGHGIDAWESQLPAAELLDRRVGC